MYIPTISDYLKILTDEEVKYFAIINFGECFKFRREVLYSKLGEEKIVQKLLNNFILFSNT